MRKIDTLQQFLDASGAQYRIFDLGRRVIKIDKGNFQKIENCQAPYPYPLQRHAWFSVLFWDPKNTNNHHVWFLKFPLDEQGYLDLHARDDFLRRALEQLGNAIIGSQETGEPSKELKDNPWSYTPHQDKMATFHAKALVELKLPGSQYLASVITYLSHPEQFSQWQHIGLQGIADLCARCENTAINKQLTTHLSQLPNDVLIPILLGLENETISHTLTQAVINCTPAATEKGGDVSADDIALLAAIIRALSGSTDNQTRKNTILDIIALCNPSAVSIEVLVAISGRSWEALDDDHVAFTFVEALARNDAGQQAFNQVLTDLLFMPLVGKRVRQTFRSPERSETLGNAIGNFLSTVH